MVERCHNLFPDGRGKRGLHWFACSNRDHEFENEVGVLQAPTNNCFFCLFRYSFVT